MSSSSTQAPSSLLEYLPAIYQEEPFVGQFLSAAEKILFGRSDGVTFPVKGLEEIISGLAGLFDPIQTPREFLSWLAEWTALSLRADLDETKQRNFIARIVQLYRRRGTKKNLQDLLAIFTVGIPAVTEAGGAESQIAVHSTIGQDIYLGGGPPHFFHVTISLPRAAPEAQTRQLEIAHALIELEKPAYTTYKLDVVFPSMQIGVYSTVGVDTLLGTATP
jgi:phage tail-like protein